jgi:hypothetical protein
MNSPYVLADNQTEEPVEKKPQYKELYVITHLIVSFFAIYLSWKCNNGFSLVPFLVAFFCPYLYIIWALATKGGCGVFEEMPKLTVPTTA